MNEAEQEGFVFRELSSLPPSAAGDPFNFINDVLEFLTKWTRAYGQSVPLGQPAYCCFIGRERLSTAINASAGLTEYTLFREDTPPYLLGKLYFCSLSFSKVYGRASDCNSLDAFEKEIQSYGVPNCPVVIFNAADRRVLWRTGVDLELHQAILLDSNAPALTSSSFEQALKNFHHEYTETPQGLTKPWKNASKLITKDRLEDEIRDDLYVYLRFLVGTQHAVIREHFNPAGRADLLVCFHFESKYFSIELKVFRHSQDAIAWGKHGIAQAFGYKQGQRGISLSYACCFDGREDNVEIAELREFAQEKDVLYRRFFMYPSTEAFQQSLMQ